MKRLLCFVAILFLSLPFVSAETISVDVTSTVKTQPAAPLGFTFNGAFWSNYSELDVNGDGSKEVAGSTERVGNTTWWRERVLTAFPYGSFFTRGDMYDDYGMNAVNTSNSHFNGVTPRNYTNLKNQTDWFYLMNATVSLTILHTPYFNADQTRFPCASSNLTCPPIDYSVDAKVKMNSLEKSGYIPFIQAGRAYVELYNEPYLRSYWLAGLAQDSGANCQIATEALFNYTWKMYGNWTAEAAVRGYSLPLSTPSFAPRSDNIPCNNIMSQSWHGNFSPNGVYGASFDWDCAIYHVYSSSSSARGDLADDILEVEAEAASYGYSCFRVTEGALNSDAASGRGATAENVTRLNNGYWLMYSAMTQADIGREMSLYVGGFGSSCRSLVNYTDPEQCYYAWGEVDLETRGMGLWFANATKYCPGLSKVRPVTNGSSTFGTFCSLPNGTDYFVTGYQAASGTISVTLDVPTNVTNVTDVGTLSTLTPSAGSVNAGTYSPGMVRIFLVNYNSTSTSSSNKKPIVVGGRVFRYLNNIVFG